MSTKTTEDFIKELEGFLQSRNFKIKNYIQFTGNKAKTTQQLTGAVGIQFDYKTDKVDYGTVTLLVDTKGITILYDEQKIKNSADSGFTKFIRDLKNYAFSNGLLGDSTPMNIDNLDSELKKRIHKNKEDTLSEGWYGNKHTSYNKDRIPTIKLIVKHNSEIGEGDKRYHHIDKIFLENEIGERLLVDTKKPSIARAFARHLAEGGKYNDDRWNHIKEMADDISKLSGFIRATKSGQFNEGVGQVVSQVMEQYKELRTTINKLQGSRGYNQYFEGWQPTLVEGDSECDYSGMFTTSRIDPRIERALPVLSKLKISFNEISEANEFEDWATAIVETLSPVMQKNVDDFVKLLSDSEVEPVGINAINWKSKLDDFIVNQRDKDDLFSELEDIADTDPDNDGKPVVLAWLQKHKNDEFYGQVLDSVEASTEKTSTDIPGITKEPTTQPKAVSAKVPEPKIPTTPKEPALPTPVTEHQTDGDMAALNKILKLSGL